MRLLVGETQLVLVTQVAARHTLDRPPLIELEKLHLLDERVARAIRIALDARALPEVLLHNELVFVRTLRTP
jgi:hypothetical protein